MRCAPSATMTPIDDTQRTAALNLHHSIIVQAPAGSGKTELLCRRFLVALASVEQPEQVLAITFTRKAAEEMRERILRYLHDAAHPLGQKVLAQDAKHQWQLLTHPERLAVMTIDGLCMRIMDQAPIALALLGFQVADDATLLYRAAVDLLFEDVDQAHPWQQAFHTLLLRCHNRWQSLHDLCVEMLAKREQWGELISELNQQPEHWRTRLESGLHDCLAYAIETLDQQLSPYLKEKLLTLLRFAAQHESHYQPWLALSKWPAPTVEQEMLWRSLADFLLTKDGQLRKKVDKRSGFPVGEGSDKEYFKHCKHNMLELLNEMADAEDLLPALQMMRQVPAAHYTEQQWQRVLCIVSVLRALLAYFQMAMQQKKQVDFSEIAMRALAALGHDEMPSELALTLDYRLQHILVDEFQDTSLLQFRLVERLTQSWQSGDGRSLFVVGDPLQSIYRFRQAEVGLFLKVWQQGFSHLPLQPIQLKQNFRAQENLVAFYNDELAQLLPKTSVMYDGAVAYNAVSAAKPALPEAAWLMTTGQGDDSYLQNLLQQIKLLQAQQADCSIGLLVRARSHLHEIIPALRAAQIDFQARDLSQLSDQPVVMDLLSWLKALLNLEDRLSWLAMLHAPCLGLSLHTLQHLFEKQDAIVWQRLCTWQAAETEIDQEQANKLHSIIDAYRAARNQLQRTPLDQILWQLWHNLQAERFWSDAFSVHATQQFFTQLQQFQKAGDLPDIAEFERCLTRCVFSAKPKQHNLELMTIHKAKGLEFDVVLLPELDRGARRDDMPLLLFDEVMLPSGPKFLLAPLYENTEQKDAIFNFLWSMQKKKAQHERLRLLYVACTRAKCALYFYAQLPNMDDDEKSYKPTAGSFLADLWPVISNKIGEVFKIFFGEKNGVDLESEMHQRTPHLPINLDRD